MELLPFECSHLTGFKPGAIDRQPASLLYYEQQWIGKAVTVQENGETLGVVGIANVNGAAHIWAVMSDELRQRPIALCRMARASLPNIAKLPGIDMVEIRIDDAFPASRRWAEWLGFEDTGDGRMIWRSPQV